MKTLLLDLETRSTVDLQKAGHRRYSKDSSTSITTGAWFWKGKPNSLAGAIFIPKLAHLAAFSPFDFLMALEEADRICCHNAGFDINIIEETLKVKIPLQKISCTMARAQRMSLPGGLDELCKTLGVPGKSPGGTALVMRTCKPQKDGSFCEDEDVFRNLLAYNLQDVRALEAVDARLPELPPAERVIWERTWRKNELGLTIDLDLARAVAARRQEIETETANTLRGLTWGAVTAVTQRSRIQAWLAQAGVPMKDMRKETVDEALQNENLLPEAYEVLTLVKENGGMAPTKAASLLERQIDGSYKDHTRYFGARSGRGTSEGANTFNLARPSGKYDVDDAIEGLLLGFLANNVMLTDVLRGMVAAPPGFKILDADLANIELRLALWLAGDEDRLKILASGGDLYLHNAIDLFGLPKDATKKTHGKERQDAKTITLGCNYGLGDGRFYASQRYKIPGLTPEKSKAWVQRYRSLNPKLAAKDGIWRQLDSAAREAFYRPDLVFETAGGKIAFCYSADNPWPMAPDDRLIITGRQRVLWLRLPSNRPVPHYAPRIDADSGDMTFLRAKFGTMLPQKAYGGAWLEIISQSSARDILTRCEELVERELPDVQLRMDIYDSLVATTPAAVAEERLKQILAIMRRPIPWAPGLPLDADAYPPANRMKK